MNQKLLLVALICALSAYPAASISRWFSASYNDLKFTLYRFGHCYAGLAPLNSTTMNETQFLVHQMKLFLDQGNYDNEQLANVTALMDSICRQEHNYAVSMNINISQFDGDHNKAARCQAIEDAMDSMYYVFRRSALNRSEPLDFFGIQFYPNASDRNVSYNVIDLINVSWIKSSMDVEGVCAITSPIKEHIALRMSNSTAQARVEQPIGALGAVMELLNRLLDPILGLQKRLYWESSNRLGQLQKGISSGVMGVRDGIGSGLSSARRRIFGSRSSNATTSGFNSTRLTPVLTDLPRKPLNGSQTFVSNSTPAPARQATTSTSATFSTANGPTRTTSTNAPNMI